MKITQIELFEVPPRWLFLKVSTDEGLVGWGEPVVEGQASTVAAAVREMEDFLIGSALPFQNLDFVGVQGLKPFEKPPLAVQTVGAQVAGDPLRACALGEHGPLHRIGPRRAARLAHGRHVVDVDVQPRHFARRYAAPPAMRTEHFAKLRDSARQRRAPPTPLWKP